MNILRKKNSMLILFSIFLGSCTSPKNNEKLWVGTYTNGTSDGVYVVDVNSPKLKSTLEYTIDNPSYMDFNKDLVAMVSENKEGGVALSNKSGEIALRFSSHGSYPCYIAISPQALKIAYANYVGGNVVVYDRKSKQSKVYHQEGTGPVLDRQEASHMHCVTWGKDDNTIFTIDLGSDQLMMHSFIEKNVPDRLVFRFHPGKGPRHMLWSRDHQFALVVTELSNEIYILAWDEERKIFIQTDVVKANQGVISPTYVAAVKMSKDEKYVYVSNRGENSIVRFSLDRETLKLNDPVWTNTEGNFPRDFAISKDGKKMAVANQKDGGVTLFDIDNKGIPHFTGKRIQLDQPVYVRFR
ncbi:lactonase family protein [Halosquirtibacter laminarini]|uniref:Lactonase family protein n=1 Tax=Halosquirtibacter laminarini TaxID=3374600 RepID=A0AC61NPH0_9BACT|nr:lactonase family protein [Prolixibacteraceae bacterium]